MNASGGTVGSLSASGGSTTIGSLSSVGSVTVSGGQVSISSTRAMALLSLTGGALSLPSGGTAGTVDVSAGLGTLSAPSPIAVTSTLKLSNSVTAAITGASSFKVSGTNLANNTQASTLTLSGGVLKITPSGQLTAGTAINVGLSNMNVNANVAGPYTGPGPSADTGTVWNNPTYAKYDHFRPGEFFRLGDVRVIYVRGYNRQFSYWGSEFDVAPGLRKQHLR